MATLLLRTFRVRFFIACVAGGISRASALFCEDVNGSGEAVGGLVKSRVEFSLAVSPLANSSRASPAMEYSGSAAARPLSHPSSYAGYFFKKIQDWICKSERIRKRTLRFLTRQINLRSISRILVRQRNRRIHRSRFFGSFYAPYCMI